MKKRGVPFWAFIACIVISFVGVYLLAQFVFQPVFIPTASMEPEIHSGSFVFCNKTAYWGDKSPERGDIVIFHSDELGEELCKRVIGLPGDTVSVDNGTVYIDGNPLAEPYISNPDDSNMDSVTVPDGAYFLMGDNRLGSYDSRYWATPCIDEKDIMGKVVK